MQFSYSIDDLELRSCDENLLINNKPHSTAEIIRHKDNGAYSIARWERCKEGFDLCYIGSRPFDNEISMHDFMVLSKLGQSILDAIFTADNRE